MALQPLVDAVYQVVRYSWLVASLAVKYVLAVYVFRLWSRGSLDLESFQDVVLDYSRATVTGIVAAGVLFASLGLEVAPVSRVFSGVVAVAYLLYLFWVY